MGAFDKLREEQEPDFVIGTPEINSTVTVEEILARVRSLKYLFDTAETEQEKKEAYDQLAYYLQKQYKGV